jgi:2-oxoisovalerate dehydrogenase E2 component (dihydrolipoyl transacylase)
VKPSSTISAFDPLCEVQSDKASVEITSPYDGVVKEILVQEGQVAKVGEGLCLIEVEEDVAAVVDSEAAEPSVQTETVMLSGSMQVEETNSDSQPNHGLDPDAAPVPTPTPTPSRRPHPLDPSSSTSGASSSSNSDADVLATPSTRHFAKSKGVDLALLMPGSGKNGRVEKRDVEAYLAGSHSSQASMHGASGQMIDAGKEVVVDLGRTRYGMWKAMVKVRYFFFL